MPNEPTPELRLIIMRITRLMRSQRADGDLSDGQLSVLSTLGFHGPKGLGELAEHERVTPPSMHRTIKALETAGLITRTGAADDGRKIVIDLTDAGRTIIEETRRQREAWFARRLSALTPEQRAILAEAEPVLREMYEQ